MNGFKSQQHRWTKGSIQTCKKFLPTIWRSELPLLIKLEATGHLTSNFAYLLLACLCVLLHPSTGGPQTGWVRTFLVDVPIFLTASVSVAVFYICAQRELHPRTWMKEILLLALSARARRRSFAQQCARRSRSGVQSSIGFRAHARNTASSTKRSHGATANTCRLNHSCRSPRWLSRSTSPTSSGSRSTMGNFFRCHFSSMFQVGFLYVSLSSLAQWWPKFSFGAARTRRGNSCVTNGKISDKYRPMFRRRFLSSVCSCLFLSLMPAPTSRRWSDCVIVSVKDQKLMLVQGGAQVAIYPVSTSSLASAIPGAE